MGKYLVILSMIFGFSILYWASLSEPNIIMGENYCRGWTTTTDVRRLTTSQAHAMTSPRTSRMGGALPLLAMNGWGIHVRVHNESSASAQSTRTSSMLAMNWAGLYSMCTMRALQVDRLQRRRDLADGCKGLSSGSPLPMGFHSSSLVRSPSPNHTASEAHTKFRAQKL